MCVASFNQGHHGLGGGNRTQDASLAQPEAAVFYDISSPILVFFCLCKTLHKLFFMVATEKKSPCVQGLAWCPALTLPPQQGRDPGGFSRTLPDSCPGRQVICTKQADKFSLRHWFQIKVWRV